MDGLEYLCGGFGEWPNNREVAGIFIDYDNFAGEPARGWLGDCWGSNGSVWPTVAAGADINDGRRSGRSDPGGCG